MSNGPDLLFFPKVTKKGPSLFLGLSAVKMLYMTYNLGVNWLYAYVGTLLM